MIRLRFTDSAKASLKELAQDAGQRKRLKSVQKALGLLEVNLRHPSLRTHKFVSVRGPKGEEVFEAYAENRTPAAYRIFWCYGPRKDEITVIAITPHP
jgi:hypothetical protein